MSKQTWIAVAIALGLGVAGGYGLSNQFAGQPAAASAEPASASASAQKKPLFYRNPMNPDVTSPVPAKDNMGMDYVPVYADAAAGAAGPAGTVTIDASARQNIGVRTHIAEQRAFTHSIRTIGRVGFDEEQLTRLHPKTEGWVEKLLVDKTGQPVKQGATLLRLYSPQIVSTQEEYLLALKSAETLKNNPYADIRQTSLSLADGARRRLQLLDVPEAQIRQLEKTARVQKSIPIAAPASGTVMTIGVREGQFITPQTELYRLADLSTVWVMAQIYEYELPWVKVGDQATISATALAGQTVSGRVDYIYPYMENQTRTVQVRIELDNSDGALKPDMFVDVALATAEKPDAIVIPEEAVVRSGEHEQVFVQRAPGQFEPRDVTLGLIADGLVEIVRGVQAGDVVVTSSQFLIDSESKLREATAKMLAAPDQPTPPADAAAAPEAKAKGEPIPPAAMDGMPKHDMGSMQMDDMPNHDMSNMQKDDMPSHDMGNMQMDDMPSHDMGSMQMDGKAMPEGMQHD
jgi:Cu(I)/Ag(I) efflux system membrane fusion protein